MVGNNKTNKGFTLVELIIVVAVIAILAGVLAPQYLQCVERSRETNDIQVATQIMRATTTVMNVPKNNLPSGTDFTITWHSVEGEASDSNLRDKYHSNGLSLAEHLGNEIKAIISQGNGIAALSDAGKTQDFIFGGDVNTGKIEVADENPSPAANGWNAGRSLWVTEIGVKATLSDEFYYYY